MACNRRYFSNIYWSREDVAKPTLSPQPQTSTLSHIRLSLLRLDHPLTPATYAYTFSLRHSSLLPFFRHCHSLFLSSTPPTIHFFLPLNRHHPAHFNQPLLTLTTPHTHYSSRHPLLLRAHSSPFYHCSIFFREYANTFTLSILKTTLLGIGLTYAMKYNILNNNTLFIFKIWNKYAQNKIPIH